MAKRGAWEKTEIILAEAYYERAITLPVLPSTTDEQAEKVVEAVQRVLAHS